MDSIPLRKFYTKKYGNELLVDVIGLEEIRKGVRRSPVHRFNFYSIILITAGDGEVAINDCSCHLGTNHIICAIPGEVWHWHWHSHTNLNGYFLLFEEKFLLSFFNDRAFLRNFRYLQAERSSPFLKLPNELFNRVKRLLAEMKTEINDHSEQDHHILRAMLYETLMLLNRACPAGESDNRKDNIKIVRYIDPFVRMVDAECTFHRNTQYYADKLCISSNYLNKIVHGILGSSAKSFILTKVIHEAERLLDYTTLSEAEIANRLHFDNSSYFIRLFRKHTGSTPGQYRKRVKP